MKELGVYSYNSFLENIIKKYDNVNERNFILNCFFELINYHQYPFFVSANRDIYIGSDIFLILKEKLFLSSNLYKQTILKKYFNKKNIKKNIIRGLLFEKVEVEKIVLENNSQVDYNISNSKKTRDEYLESIRYKLRVNKNQVSNNLTKKELISKRQKARLRKKIKNEENDRRRLEDYNRKYQNNRYFLSLDIEAFEFKQDKLLEIGYSFYDKETKNVEIKNYIVKENLKYKNKRYVKSDSENVVDNCEIEVLELEHIYSKLLEIFSKTDIFVGHSISSEKDFFKSSGGKELTNIMNLKENIDTAKLFKILENQTCSLKNLCEKYKINCMDKPFHNAVNDSFFTLNLLNNYYNK